MLHELAVCDKADPYNICDGIGAVPEAQLPPREEAVAPVSPTTKVLHERALSGDMDDVVPLSPATAVLAARCPSMHDAAEVAVSPTPRRCRRLPLTGCSIL